LTEFDLVVNLKVHFEVWLGYDFLLNHTLYFTGAFVFFSLLKQMLLLLQILLF